MISRSPTFEEGSQGTTISSLSEKSKEETGISLQVNIRNPVIICMWYVGLSSHRDIIDFKTETRAGEMAQRLTALAALPEVMSSILSNHTVAHNHL